MRSRSPSATRSTSARSGGTASHGERPALVLETGPRDFGDDRLELARGLRDRRRLVREIGIRLELVGRRDDLEAVVADGPHAIHADHRARVGCRAAGDQHHLHALRCDEPLEHRARRRRDGGVLRSRRDRRQRAVDVEHYDEWSAAES
jgi:hypothetical protein